MSKTLKWIYRLGYDKGRNTVIAEIEKARDFESYQEQIKGKREYDERETGFKHKTTPKMHEQRCEALEDLLNRIDPEKYPNITRYMDLLS